MAGAPAQPEERAAISACDSLTDSARARPGPLSANTDGGRTKGSFRMHSASRRTPPLRRVGISITAVLALAAVAALGASALAQGKQAGAAATLKITSKPWGTVGGKAVKLYTLSNGSMKVNITNFGGIVQSISVPGK